MIKNSKILAISGSSGSIGMTANYSKEILKLESRLEDTLDNIVAEFREKSISQYIHLAAKTDINWCNKNKEECYLFNSEYVKKFFLAASKAQLNRFVFVSSSHVYELSNKIPIDIGSPLKPNSIYGKSKLMAEKELLALNNLNTKLSIARVFSVFGDNARDHFLYQGLHRRAKNKDFSLIPGLDSTRDFLDTSDVMTELIRLVRSYEFPTIVNICSGEGKTIRQIAREVFSLYGLEEKIDQMHPIKENSFNKIVGVPTQFK